MAVLERPPEEPADPKRGSRVVVSFSALVFLAGAGVLLLLPLGLLGIAVLIGGVMLTGVVGLHYLVWGHWISRVLERHENDNQEEL